MSHRQPGAAQAALTTVTLDVTAMHDVTLVSLYCYVIEDDEIHKLTSLLQEILRERGLLQPNSLDWTELGEEVCDFVEEEINDED